MKKVLTIVFDGFGMRDEEKGNAVKAAKMNNFISFYERKPHTLLNASEESVGLLPGQMGNSEIGHMSIGAGKVIKSNMSLINEFLEKTYLENEDFNNLLKMNDKTVHIIGLCSDGNVHSSLDSFISLYTILAKNNFKKIYFHLITDGRDTKIDAAGKYVEKIEKLISKYNVGKIASICGRYYAMDRDENFDRTQKYYDLITRGIGDITIDVKRYLVSNYNKGIYDEFIRPTIIDKEGIINDGDIVFWMNFRTDRSKQILLSLTSKNFDKFRIKNLDNTSFYSFFEMDKNIDTTYFLKADSSNNPLGIYLSKLGIKQARIAESEKFAHVTYFFDGGYNGKIEGCDKFNLPSPDVPTYDQMPEMNAVGVTRKIIDCMEKDYQFIFANFANPDMVGHTGNMSAATKACMALDVCLAKIIEVAEDNFYTIFLLADHGNADTMLNSDGSICTTHSLAKVPFISSDEKVSFKDDGDLTNVAPTILDYMDISIPEEMESNSLLITE